MYSDYALANVKTGEMLDIRKLGKVGKTLSKSMVDNMLMNAKSFDEIDENLLRHWLYIINEINKENKEQFRIWGDNMDREVIFKKPIEENITKYVSAIIILAHKWSNRLMKTERTGITSWKDLWTTIGCNGRGTQVKVKKFLDQNNLVRKTTISTVQGDMVQFYLNPFLFRNKHFINQVAINVFRDCAKESVNINTYTYRYLQKIDVLDR